MAIRWLTKTIVSLICVLACLLTGTLVDHAQSEEPTCPGEKRALVLSGGGIRGAYQVGSIWYLVNALNCDFDHFVGTSTGALTAVVLAQASDHRALQERVDLLVRQYASLKTQDDLVQPRAFAKVRLFLPSWLGGVDGLYSLAPIEKRLREQIDVTKIRDDNLTVTAVSLQSGSLDYFKPVSLLDYVLGSASIPLAIDPKQTRLWIRGVAVSTSDHAVVISTPFPPGLADNECQIRLSEHVVARCEQVSAEIEGYTVLIASGNEYQSWRTTLRIVDAPADAWAEFSERVRRADGNFDERLLNLLTHPLNRYRTIFDVMTAWKGGLLVEFTTRHQLIDGGVTENLPIQTAMKLRFQIDTLIVLAAGDTLLGSKSNTVAHGGAEVASRAFEVLWGRYQQSTLDYIGLTWNNEFGYTEGAKRVMHALIPKLVLIEPWDRFFHDTLEVNPEAIRKAMMHGCVVASALASSKISPESHFVSARMYFKYGDRDERPCQSLQGIINSAAP